MPSNTGKGRSENNDKLQSILFHRVIASKVKVFEVIHWCEARTPKFRM